MPEIHFHIRWPDGSRRRCYSPSTVVRDYLVDGRSYPVDDFVRRHAGALTVASQRVRERYGSGCPRAVREIDEIQRAASRFAPPAGVLVEGFDG